MHLILSLFVLIIILGLLVFIHELGHFVAAKLIGAKVEEFAFGFGPRLLGKKIRGTEYKINLIPLGGYVKIYGELPGNDIQADGKLVNVWKEYDLYKITDREELSKKIWGLAELKDSEKKELIKIGKERIALLTSKDSFLNKSVFKRAFVLVAGVTMNFLLAILIFLLYFSLGGFTTEISKRTDYDFWGSKQRVDERPIIVDAYTKELKEAGVERTLVWKIDGELVQSREQFSNFLKENEGEEVKYTLIDEGGNFVDKTITLNTSEFDTNLDEEVQGKIRIAGVSENFPAHEAGLVKGNIIFEINDEETGSVENFIKLLEAYQGETVSLKILNEEGEIEIVEMELLQKVKEDDPVIGAVLSQNETIYLEFYHLDYSDSKLLSGFFHSINILGYQIKVLGVLVRDSFVQGSVEPVASGVGSIVVVANEVNNLVRANNFSDLLNLTGLVSIALAFMNILPIPLFDGGHLMFLALEKIRGKRIPIGSEEIISKLSFLFIIILSIVIILKDIIMLEWIPRILELVRGLVS
ncbi:site-2 protease family protein [Candidatus Dojkabacteria bacterium]|nr:site-2 protease family protein [Candidatus Dojkabacteria bacterium]